MLRLLGSLSVAWAALLAGVIGWRVNVGSSVGVEQPTEADRGHATQLPADLRAAFASDVRGIPLRGVAVPLRRGWGAPETYFPLLDEIAKLGANTVLLNVAGHMEHARAQGIFVDARSTPTAEDLVSIIRAARGRGMRVVLMPIVLIKHPRGNEWRGVIEPPRWEEWWRDYRDFIKYFADIADAGGADALIIGSELLTTERFTNEWLKTIRLARAHFPEGALGYSANWDHYRKIEFWQQLDFVGLNSYWKLADRALPSVNEVVARWDRIRRDLLAWQREVQRPLVFTEVGWCSQEGAAMEPWNYLRSSRATPAGLEEQRRLYEAFIKAWNDPIGVAGVIWWEWTAAPGGLNDYTYTPKNKPAEHLLRAWLREGSPTTQPATAPAP